jgi:hypothetical protein
MMRAAYISGVLLPLALVLTAPAGSLADVRIQLRNESAIIADECQDQIDRYVCFKMGGTFEIEKKDIVSIKNITVRSQGVPVTELQNKTSGSQPAQLKQNGSGEEAAKKGGAGQTQDKIAAPPDPFAEKALELQTEREKLVKEKQQIQEEIKNAPIGITAFQINDLNRRNAELDEKIRKFNEEARRLMEEDKKLQTEPKK